MGSKSVQCTFSIPYTRDQLKLTGYYIGVMDHPHVMEENVLFNDALNTFYLWLYGIRHMVKDHSDSERGNLLPPHGLSFQLAAILLYASSHRQDNT